jgi:ectoine hydroxylase-related dioxygenase (phytanoyl-CoA dioxygenase family)
MRIQKGSPDIAIKAQFMLSDTNNNSPFMLIPGSHLWDIKDVYQCNQSAFEEQSTRVNLQKGDILLFSQRLIHGAGPHPDNSIIRESIFVKYHQDWSMIPGEMNMEHLINNTTSEYIRSLLKHEHKSDQELELIKQYVNIQHEV